MKRRLNRGKIWCGGKGHPQRVRVSGSECCGNHRERWGIANRLQLIAVELRNHSDVQTKVVTGLLNAIHSLMNKLITLLFAKVRELL